MLKINCLLTPLFSFALLLGTAQAASNFGIVPLYFEQNKGQTDAHARYLARSANLVGFVLQNGWTLSLHGQPISMHIKDADPQAALIPENPIEGITNYYLGSRTITNLPHYSSVRAKNIRPGIDIVYHGNQRELEYDLVIHPGADVASLWLRFEGSQPVLADNGDIILKTDQGEVRQHKPRVWQEASGQRTEVDCRYVLAKSGAVGFVLSNYDRSVELIVDPIISYSTYLGGTSVDQPAGIAVDPSGYAYVAGTTSSADFPATSRTYHGKTDVFVTKLNPSGTGLVYSTFIGGTASDTANGIALDSAGNAYVTGNTNSTDFPVTVNQFTAGEHAFVLRLGTTGNIVYSTALAGDGLDIGNAIATDASGAAYVAGVTFSTNFPVTAGSYKTTASGGGDAFVAKLSSTGQVSYATYLGGISYDFATALAVDALGNAFVGGNTMSTDFPVTPGAYASAFAGVEDAFVVKLNPAGSSLVYATYLGGSGSDYLTGLAVDAAGNCYVTGSTGSHDFPITPGAFSTTRGSVSFNGSGFLTKLNATGNSLLYSTFLGGSINAAGQAVAVDSSGSAYVAGDSESIDFPTTPGALKALSTFEVSNCCGADMFLSKVAVDGTALLYSTLLGGGAGGPKALALDGSGGVYIVGVAAGLSYPTTAGAFQTSNPKNIGPPPFSIVVSKIDFNDPTLCNPSVAPQSQNMPSIGGAISFNLTLSPGCPWEIVSHGLLLLKGPWNGVISASPISITGIVQQNATGSSVTASVRIGSATFTVNQDAGSCQEPLISLAPYPLAWGGESRLVNLTLPDSCPWTAVSGAPWLTVFQNPSGVGRAIIGISAGANNSSQRSTTLTIAGTSITVTQSGQPTLSVSHTSLNFASSLNGIATSPQTITVTFTGAPGLNWTATSNLANIVVLPGYGFANGSFQVSASSGPNGIVTVTADGFVGSPKQIQVNISNAPIGNPFGSFDTPADNTSGVAGALPVTGWALDSVEVVNVDIWREPVGSEPAGALIFIGDAVFVEGARPDVESLNPNVSFNYRAGWGYQMLTNFLPQGNGTFKLHAIAHNKAGNSTDLGTKTIIVDNAHSSKPFGTIDTPAQGGTASGNAYVNFGWALTQNPNKIPIDGSTISVVIDGQVVGHPTYNQFRSDIATLFPGYTNSGGAVGFFSLDTTNLTNGVHTISWNVFDNAGNGAGIGSRYFTVFNNQTGLTNQFENKRNRAAPVRKRIPNAISTEELALVELPLGAISGHQLVNNEPRPLPIGSSLKSGVFYWQPGPGFLGPYHLVFQHNDGTESHVLVKINPKTYR
jgi:hypothetical protein